jgi:hypothetical protein
LNRGARFCRPLRNHSATWPNTQECLANLILRPGSCHRFAANSKKAPPKRGFDYPTTVLKSRPTFRASQRRSAAPVASPSLSRARRHPSGTPHPHLWMRWFLLRLAADMVTPEATPAMGDQSCLQSHWHAPRRIRNSFSGQLSNAQSRSLRRARKKITIRS